MNTPLPVRLVSVKLTPVGRAQSFLHAHPPEERPLRSGDQVIV